MRDYTVQELSAPETYAQDAELAALARRIALSRWTAELGVSLSDWKQAHLRGEHAEILKCALEALLQHEARTRALAESARSPLRGFTPPEGWAARVDGDALHLTGEATPSLSAALRRAGGELIGTGQWRLPLVAASRLCQIFNRAEIRARRSENLDITTRQRIERWLCHLQAKAEQGWIYTKAVTVLARLGISEHPDLHARMTSILMRAASVAALPADAKSASALALTPSKRLPRRLLPMSQAPALGVIAALPDGEFVVFTSATTPFVIRPEHPSVYGAHLRDHVGQMGAYFYYRPSISADSAPAETFSRAIV